jgi:hypothetical protein
VTPAMLEALQSARKGPLRRVHDIEHGRPAWPAHPASLRALVRHGLAVSSERLSKAGHRVEEWTITEDGRKALNTPVVVVRERVRSLRVYGGSTRMMQLGAWVDVWMPEPEPVRPQDVDALWFGAAAERHAIERDRRTAARRVARAA